MNYKFFLEQAKVDINNITTLKMINYNMLKNTSSVEISRISNINSEYRSDFDESFLGSRIRTQKGLMRINDKEDLNKFLNLKVSDGDIIIIPKKIEYIEIIGAVNCVVIQDRELIGENTDGKGFIKSLETTRA